MSRREKVSLPVTAYQLECLRRLLAVETEVADAPAGEHRRWRALRALSRQVAILAGRFP